jgi:hypothetical protein
VASGHRQARVELRKLLASFADNDDVRHRKKEHQGGPSQHIRSLPISPADYQLAYEQKIGRESIKPLEKAFDWIILQLC